jgi:TetR/AcrR family transcriptional repressor of mexJK operon
MSAELPETLPNTRGGRPTRVVAAQRDERLLAVAATMFMERGFDATTMDAVAEAACVGKATLYARCRDKEALFAEVFRRQINRLLAPLNALAIQPGLTESIEDTLCNLGHQLLRCSLLPEVVAINRILAAQATRFPDLARLAHQEGWSRGLDMVAAVLRRFAEAGLVRITDPELAAEMFLCLVLGRTTRMAAFGLALPDDAALARRVRFAVGLFLDGVGSNRPPDR